MTTDRLPRLIGPISAALFTVGWTIGSAIFRVPGQVASGGGSVGATLLLWIGGGVVALCGAYCYAEPRRRSAPPSAPAPRRSLPCS